MSNEIECDSCESIFKIKHEMDKNYYSISYCPFCGEELDRDEEFEFKEWDDDE